MTSQNRNYPTRMHEVLGVEAGQLFSIYDFADDEFFLNIHGRVMLKVPSGACPASGEIISHAINHGITRRPRQEDDDANKGLYSKYKVTKADGTPLDGDCFVLRPDRDEAAISALEAYAEATNNEKLAADIREWLQTTRKPRLTQEQVEQLKALVTLGFRWLIKNNDCSAYAYTYMPERMDEWWNGLNAEVQLFIDMPTGVLYNLVSWSDPAPLDIVATLKAAGVEVEG